MKSEHVRRLESLVSRTAARFVEHAAAVGAGVADLPAMKLPWYRVRNQAGDEPSEAPDTATVFIFDEIGGSFGVSAKNLTREIQDITAPRINVRINSPGGSVFDAIAIHSALLHHPAQVRTYVDGLAASAASVIAMAADPLDEADDSGGVVMMPGSQMMIHDASMHDDGTAADKAKASTFLDRQSANLADLYRRRAGGSVAEWRDLMIAETWAFAQEAVDLRLADRVEEPPAAPEPDTDPGVVDKMKRSFDLSQYRYAGRASAPPPGRPGTGPSTRRSRNARVSTRTAARGDARSAAQARRAAADALPEQSGTPASRDARMRPSGDARILSFPAELRAKLVDFKGKQMYRVEGYATVFGRPYEMWDDFGPYQERVNARAANASLAAGPDTAFLTNHKGITMARTTNGTLTLAADERGMPITAYLNPDRQDVRDLVSAIDDELVTEMSLAFMLNDGVWNDALDEFEILELDIDRGDVSAVNYGANPYTSIAARSREIITHDLDRMPPGAARAALQRLQAREDIKTMPVFSADVMALLGERIGTAVQAALDEIDVSVHGAEPGPAAVTPEPPAPPAATPRADVLPIPAMPDGRSLDATAAWLAAVEAEKIGGRP